MSRIIRLSMAAVVLVTLAYLYIGKRIETNTNFRPPTTTRRTVMLNAIEMMDRDLTLTKGYSQTLTLRMAAKPDLVQRLYCTVLRSAALFWSQKLGHITLILDEESPADHEFAARLSGQERSLGMKFDFMYEPLPADPTILIRRWKPPGYNRQLWSSFFMDQYINASIIAWTDTDAVFTTPVTPENIFNGNRLRVFGVGNWHNAIDLVWAQETEIAIGKKMLATTAYFPIYIWRDTITNCRNYILKHMKVSHFDDAFSKMYQLRRSLSPANIMMTYAYYFEHDRYDWHLDVNNSLQDYNKKHMSPGFKIKPDETLPDLHVTIHDTYYGKDRSPMKQGYCTAKREVDALPANCEEFKNEINFQLFEFSSFENHLDSWCKVGKGRKRCIGLIESHYRNVGRYYKTGMYDLDLRRVYAVERAAAEVNISCPKIF